MLPKTRLILLLDVAHFIGSPPGSLSPQMIGWQYFRGSQSWCICPSWQTAFEYSIVSKSPYVHYDLVTKCIFCNTATAQMTRLRLHDYTADLLAGEGILWDDKWLWTSLSCLEYVTWQMTLERDYIRGLWTQLEIFSSMDSINAISGLEHTDG